MLVALKRHFERKRQVRAIAEAAKLRAETAAQLRAAEARGDSRAIGFLRMLLTQATNAELKAGKGW